MKIRHPIPTGNSLPTPNSSRLPRLLLACICSALALDSARATLLVDEPFNLPLGDTLNNSGSGTGWGANVWTNCTGFTNVAQTSFSAGSGATAYAIQQSGNAAQHKLNAVNDPERWLGQTYTVGDGVGEYPVLWVAWLLDTTGSGAVGHGFEFRLRSGSVNQVRVGKQINNNDWSIQVAGGVRVQMVSPFYGNWFSVLKLEYNAIGGGTIVTHYRCANGETTADLTDPTTFSLQYIDSGTFFGKLVFDNIQINAHNNLNQKWDEIRVGDTYADVAPVNSSKAITWAGYVDNIWAVNPTLNWTNLATATADTFANGANVTFDDTPGAAQTITVNGTPLPGSTTVNAGNDYTFNGSFGGDGALTKNNSGMLTLNGANSYNGATVINAGKVVLGDSGALGSFAGGTAVNPDAILDFNGYSIGAENMTMNAGTFVNGSSTAVVVGSTYTCAGGTNYFGGLGDLKLTAPCGGLSGVVVKTNANKMTVTASFPQSSGIALRIFEGTYEVGDGTVSGAIGANTVVNEAALVLNPGASTPVTVNGAISGGGTLTKIGAGTALLSGNSTYTNVTLVNEGTLRVGSANGLGSTVGGTVVASGAALGLNGQSVGSESVTISGTGVASLGALLNDGATAASLAGVVTLGSAATIGGSNHLSLSQPLVGGGYSLTKVGSGTLFLNGGFTGGGAITVAPGAGFGGGAVLSSVVTVGSGARIVAGNAAHVGGLSVPVLDFSGALSATIEAAPGNTIDVTSPNSLVASAAPGSITINIPKAVSGPGQFPLITYVGTIAGGGYNAFVLGTLPAFTGGYLSNNTANASIDLVVTSADYPVWTGAASSEWSTNILASPKNWKLSIAGTELDYSDGLTALFDDTASSPFVDISAHHVAPDSVTFNNSAQDYIVVGTSGITGGTGLTKLGTGSLNLSSANTYTGGTTVSGGGSIILGADNAVPSSLLTLNNGTLDVGSFGPTLSNIVVNAPGGTLAGFGTLTSIGTITLNGNATISPSIVLGASPLVWTNPVSGSVLTLNSATVLGRSGGNSLLTCYPQIRLGADVTFAQGANNNVFALAGGVDLNGNTLYLQPRNNLGGANPSLIGGPIVGNGAIVLDQEAGLYAGNNGRWVIAGANTYSGTTTINGQYLSLESPTALGNSTLIINTGFYTPSGLCNVSGNPVALTANNPLTWNGDFSFNGMTNAGVLAAYADLNLGAGAVTLGNTITVTVSNSTLTVDGVVGDGGSGFALTKNGAGALALGGVNTYAGATTVSEGTLRVNGSLNAASVVAVASGATLGGTGTIPGSVTLDSGSTVAPGASVGTLTLAAAPSLGGVTILAELNQTNTPTTADKLAITSGALNLSGATLTVTNIGPALNAGTFTLFSASGGITGTLAATNLPTLGAGQNWDTSALYALGQIKVIGDAAATNPTNITWSITGNQLNLNWPADHLGWWLQTQTNLLAVGLSNNWVDVPGSDTITGTNITVNPADPAVFYRLRKP